MFVRIVLCMCVWVSEKNYTGTSGLGAQCILRLAPTNASHIYFTGGDAKRSVALIKQAQEAGCTTPLTFVECDLTNLTSVKAAADKILSADSALSANGQRRRYEPTIRPNS